MLQHKTTNYFCLWVGSCIFLRVWQQVFELQVLACPVLYAHGARYFVWSSATQARLSKSSTVAYHAFTTVAPAGPWAYPFGFSCNVVHIVQLWSHRPLFDICICTQLAESTIVHQELMAGSFVRFDVSTQEQTICIHKLVRSTHVF
jgi:hypothetical protein